jgi:hypothetical protein
MQLDQMNYGYGPSPASAYDDNYSLLGSGLDYGLGSYGSNSGYGNEFYTGTPYGMGPMESPMLQQHQPQQQQQRPKLPNIKNIKDLVRRFGMPDATDKAHGGIAIWSANTLKKAKYGFLHRVEIIDESVPSVTPVKHFSNVYIWTHIKPTCQEQLSNILSLSKDFFYDRKKELLIVRSDSLDTAVAQASLICLYTQGKMSFYNLVNNDMLKQYYVRILPKAPKCGKVKKVLYSILKKTKKTGK